MEIERQIDETETTIALVLETNNLRSADEIDEVADELETLFGHLREQTFSLEDLDEVVVTHDGLPAETRTRLDRVAGRPLEWVRIASETGYYAAKNVGFDHTSSDVVAFGDADCRPEPEWLARLVAPLVAGDARVVAGRTGYPDDLVGRAATAVDFLYVDAPGRPEAIQNLYANNVAFRRETFAAYRYRRNDEMYRGHCLDLALRLSRDEVPIRYAPEAKTTHEWPDRWRDILRKRLVRGADTTEVAPHIVDTHVPEPLSRHLESEVRATAAVFVGRLVSSVAAVDDPARGPADRRKRRATKAAAVGLSALDAVGAALRLTGVTDFGVRDGRRVAE